MLKSVYPLLLDLQERGEFLGRLELDNALPPVEERLLEQVELVVRVPVVEQDDRELGDFLDGLPEGVAGLGAVDDAERLQRLFEFYD